KRCLSLRFRPLLSVEPAVASSQHFRRARTPASIVRVVRRGLICEQGERTRMPPSKGIHLFACSSRPETLSSGEKERGLPEEEGGKLLPQKAGLSWHLASTRASSLPRHGSLLAPPGISLTSRSRLRRQYRRSAADRAAGQSAACRHAWPLPWVRRPPPLF